MKFTLFVHPDFEKELTKASVWYEEALQGLGVDFALSVKQGIYLIQQNPLLFPLIHKNYRRILVKKFPYKIYYELIEERLVVYALIYHKNDTLKRRKKISKRK